MRQVDNIINGKPYDEDWQPIPTENKWTFYNGVNFYIFDTLTEFRTWKAVNYPTEDGEEPNNDNP